MAYEDISYSNLFPFLSHFLPLSFLPFSLLLDNQNTFLVNHTMCNSLIIALNNTYQSNQFIDQAPKIYKRLYKKWRRQWQPTPVLLSGKSHGWRSLVGCSPWGCWKSDTTERLHFHYSIPCLGEGNGNPLQCSCLENPRDRGAWWAAVYGVAQSRTRLEHLSSSSSNCDHGVGL